MTSLTEEMLATYDTLRLGLPHLSRADAMAAAQLLAPTVSAPITLPEPETPDEWLDKTLAELPKAQRIHRERKIRWTDEAKKYVVGAAEHDLPVEDMIKKLVSHYHLKNVTAIRVEAMINMEHRKANGWTDPRYEAPTRVSGGMSQQ